MLGELNPMASGYVGNVKNFGGRVLIEQKIIRSTDTASDIYFRNIPQDFNHLRIIGSIRTSHASVRDNILMQMNGDTSSTYYNSYYGYVNGTFDGGNVTSASTLSYVAQVAGNSAQNGFMGIFETLIPRYNDKHNAPGGYYRYWHSYTTFPTNVATNTSSYTFNGFWGGVVPVTQLRLLSQNATTFAEANVSLYGEV